MQITFLPFFCSHTFVRYQDLTKILSLHMHRNATMQASNEDAGDVEFNQSSCKGLCVQDGCFISLVSIKHSGILAVGRGKSL